MSSTMPFEGSHEMQPLRLFDLLDAIAEPEGSMHFTNGRVWNLKEGVSLDAEVTVIGTLTGQSNLAVMVSEEDGSICIMEA